MDAPGGFGNPRVGLLHADDLVLDAHEAHATALSNHLDPKRAFEIADALVPSDLFGFVRNGRHGWRALRLALSYLSDRATDTELLSPRGERVCFQRSEVEIRPFLGALPSNDAGDPTPQPLVYAYGEERVTRTCFAIGANHAVELAAVIGKAGDTIADDEAWEHIAGYMVVGDHDGIGSYLKSADEIHPASDADIYCELADAVSSVSRRHSLEAGDVVRTGLGQRHAIIDLTDTVLEALLNSAAPAQ